MDGFRPHPADRRFFAFMSTLAVALIVVGFGNTYGPKVFAGTPEVPVLVHVHAALFACWLVLLVTQVGLVARGHVAWHMRLGNAGIALAGLMLAVGIATAVEVARLGHRGIPGVEFSTADGFLLLNVASIVVFVLLVAAGWRWRRRPHAHRRLMLLATVAGLAPPGISRLPLVAGSTPAIAAVVMALLLAGPAYDLVTRRRVHPAYGALALAVLILPPVVMRLSATRGWTAIAAWLVR